MQITRIGITGWTVAVVLVAGPGPQKPRTAAAGYVGSEACAVCHAELAEAFTKNPHAVVDREKSHGWEKMACESCHGPGQQHSEAAEAKFIVHHLKEKPAAADAWCLSCHRNQAAPAGRIKGSHANHQTACVACHSVHHAEPDRALPLFAFRSPSVAVVSGVLDTSNSRSAKINRQCDADMWAQFLRPHSHALVQGAMSCTDCHNPHGSNQRVGSRSVARTAGNEPGCFRCHSDKRGPFTYEHASVRLQDCSTCHEPHGSANPRMLTRADTANQCLECHSLLPTGAPNPGQVIGGAVPPAFHDLRQPLYRQCTTCHVKIHGSHVSRGLLR